MHTITITDTSITIDGFEIDYHNHFLTRDWYLDFVVAQLLAEKLNPSRCITALNMTTASGSTWNAVMGSPEE